MDLFEQRYNEAAARGQPLAARLRPRTLGEYIGQEHIVGQGRLLYRAIEADQLSSLIFYGPPGTGKTSLASVIAGTTKSRFVTINAVLSGVKDIRAAIDEAKQRLKYHGERTILFVDEVHRWNKAQQDALLPWVENGTVVLIGATIENPYFEVNRALVSRSRIFQLKPLIREDLFAVVRQALSDRQRGYGNYEINIDDDALEHLVNVSGGDARSLLNALELAVETTPDRFPPLPGESVRITIAVAEESIQRRAVLYDKEGDYHFDTISAFIKSMRGSDPDAAMYWLAKMVYAGEDPHFLFRRMLIFASEDIGLADPQALMHTVAAARAFDQVGLPEGRFHLANAALYLATAQKSNSVFAFFDALKTVEQEQDGEVPNHLKDSSRDQKGFGHGEGYLYPHSYREHWVNQQYLPDSLQGKIFYRPGALGYESALGEKIEKRREAQLSVMAELLESTPEILTFSPPSRDRDRWLARAAGAMTDHLAEVRDRLFRNLRPSRHWVCLDANAVSGLFVWELMRLVPEGGVWAVTQPGNCFLKGRIEEIDGLDRPCLLEGDLSDIKKMLQDRGSAALRFDMVTARNALMRRTDRSEVLDCLRELLRSDGVLALADTVPGASQRLSELIDESRIEPDLLASYKKAEELVYDDGENGAESWNAEAARSILSSSGYKDVTAEQEDHRMKRTITPADLNRWFDAGEGATGYAARLGSFLSGNAISRIRVLFERDLAGKTVSWRRAMLYIHARKSR